LSPRALKRIESYDPTWPMPKVFRIKKKGKVDTAIFDGDTINTPSLLCVEDYLDALKWAEGIGIEGLVRRSLDNFRAVEDWVAETDWVEFLAESPEIRSHTSVCLSVRNDRFRALPKEKQSSFLKGVAEVLSKENIAQDINSYKDAPRGSDSGAVRRSNLQTYGRPLQHWTRYTGRGSTLCRRGAFWL